MNDLCDRCEHLVRVTRNGDLFWSCRKKHFFEVYYIEHFLRCRDFKLTVSR